VICGFHLGQVYEKLLRKQDAVRMYRLVVAQHAVRAEEELAVDEAHKRIDHLKLPTAPSERKNFPSLSGVEELSRERTISLPRLAPGQASAEFFVLLAPGPKVEDTKFISGSDLLKSAGKSLAQAHFMAVFPENSSGRVVRRGILACYPSTGCSFVLLPLGNINPVE